MHANVAHPSRAIDLAKPQYTDQQSTMATVQARACTILVEFERARTELVGEAVILTNGKVGIVDRLWLDEFHGLRISIRSQEGDWPVSTIKICGAAGSSGRAHSSRAAVQARPLWVKSVALCNGRLRLDFRYTLLATKLARHRNMSRWATTELMHRTCVTQLSL